MNFGGRGIVFSAPNTTNSLKQRHGISELELLKKSWQKLLVRWRPAAAIVVVIEQTVHKQLAKAETAFHQLLLFHQGQREFDPCTISKNDR